jgi:hypothetical protein
MNAADGMLIAFEDGSLDPAAFSHSAHVQVAQAMLAQSAFLDAAVRYQRGIEALARRAAAPHKANVTITLAFLSVLAERRMRGGALEGQAVGRTVLDKWYSPVRLALPEARAMFLMPDRAP